VNDLPFHLLLFAFTGTVIVTISSFFSEADDQAALRALPRRVLVFLGGCGLIAVVMLILEHTVASVH